MSQERILIAEDESRVAQALSRALSLPEGGGYAVEAYESGEEALARLNETHFDLLITDLRMPGMNGLELLDKCHEVSPNTGSILITAFGSPQIEENAARLAVDAYLTKPFSMRTLVQTVEKTLQARSQKLNRQPRVTLSDATLHGVQKRMETLRQDAGVHSVLLFDETGHLLAESGKRGDFDAAAFLASLGNAMAATNAVSEVLGDQEAFDLHFYEGKQYEIYSARVTPQVFLSLLMDKQGNNSRIGMVWLYLRRAITDLRNLIASATSDEKIRKEWEEALRKDYSSVEVDEPAASPSTKDHKAVLNYAQAKRLGLLDQDLPERN